MPLIKDITSAPALNAKNPNISVNPPINVIGTECPGMGTTALNCPLSVKNLPFLAPMNMQPTSAVTPPVR